MKKIMKQYRKHTNYVHESESKESKTKQIRFNVTPTVHEILWDSINKEGYSNLAPLMRHIVNKYMYDNQELDCDEEGVKKDD